MIRWLLSLGLASIGPAALAAEPQVVRKCDDLALWTAIPADGVSLDLALDEGLSGSALRLDFDIPGGGYAVARTELELVLPENYAFRFQIRGDAPVNHLEFKLVDETGESVWWSVRRDFAFPAVWTQLSVKKRHLDFAWGPKGGGEIHRVSAVEFAVTAGEGGTGSVWLDQIELVPLAPADRALPSPVARASSAATGHAAGLALDGDSQTAWEPSEEPEPWIELDLGVVREYSAILLTWLEDRHAVDYVLERSDDRMTWLTSRSVAGAGGGFDPLHLPESESRYLRVRMLRAASDLPVALAEVAVQPVEWAETRLEFFQRLVGRAPRGHFPRGMTGEQAYWTVVGVDASPVDALLGEDGALEWGRGQGSIEPFLSVDGRLLSWAAAEVEQSLDEGYLPLPTVRWNVAGLELTITAFGSADPAPPWVGIRYTVTSRVATPKEVGLALTVRPFQVNPPSQDLNLQGGLARIHSIEVTAQGLRVNDALRVLPLTPPTTWGMTTFDGGDIVGDHLAQGRLPGKESVHDPTGAASAALVYHFDLDPGAQETVELVVPLHDSIPETTDLNLEHALQACRRRWQELLSRVEIRLPPVAQEVEQTLRSQLAYILLNRAGPAIQPGPRSYARSWIRDGALTSSALLRLGHTQPAREFLEWYAPYQYDHGKIPCVVDARGADPVDEHDSSGEFIFLVRQVYQGTRDRELLAKMWPRVRRAAEYLDSLRQQRRTPEFRQPGQSHFFGLLPPSISHEGYSAKPMHSYWDDFFAVRGFRDATFLAAEVGDEEAARHLAAVRDEFERDVEASIQATLRHHGIDYIPGCADLGDFDATSTTIALTPARAERLLPEGALERTFERYWEYFDDRRDGRIEWVDYTPYEIRSIGAFVRLGWRERAIELLRFFLADRRPVGWRQWPEVVRRQPRQAGFLGDLPHTWVGSDYIRSVLDMLAYEEEDALVLAAGVPEDWLAPPGVVVRGLPTSYGPLSFGLAAGADTTRFWIDGLTELPADGVQLTPPRPGPRSVRVNGRAAGLTGGRIVIREIPATVTFPP